MVQRLESCCCGCTLKTGVIIITVLSLIGYVWTFAGSAVTVPGNGSTASSTIPESVSIGFACFGLLYTIVGLLGACNEKYKYVLAYFYYYTFFFTVSTVFGLVNALNKGRIKDGCIARYNDTVNPPEDKDAFVNTCIMAFRATTLVSTIVISLLAMYFCWVIWSLADLFKEREQFVMAQVVAPRTDAYVAPRTELLGV